MKKSGKIAFLVVGLTFLSSMSTSFACNGCGDKTHKMVACDGEEENLSPIDWECSGCKKKKKNKIDEMFA